MSLYLPPLAQPRFAPLADRLMLAAASLIYLLITTTTAQANYAGFDSDGPSGGSAAAATGIDLETPQISAARTNGHPIRVDGRLDDPIWQTAQAGGNFRVWDPDRGAAASEATVFKVAYDDRAIYFGVACLENDAANIASSLSRRDQLRDSDQVSIYIDPYHDKNTGYNFRVNPAGIQEDAYMFDDGNRDRDWDAVWEAETSRDEDGWYAEVRIPFSSVRYRPSESMTWGLQVYRYMHRRGEDTAWVIWDQETNGFISRFGEVTDLAGVAAPRQLEVLPYFVQRTTDPSMEGAEDEFNGAQNFGLDMKYGVTADLTLNATLQPDFGQVEADPATLNLSPFETFFSEKRPFFVEGNRFFEMPGFNLFYSRRIGTGDENSRIRAAGKLTGKAAGNVSIAALYATTDVTRAGQAHNLLKGGDHTAHYMVSRVGKDFGDGNHSVHVMQTAAIRTADRMSADDDGRDYRNGYTTGFDFASNFKDRMYNVNGQLVGTIVDPAKVVDDPSVEHLPTYGTGGDLTFSKHGGTWRGSVGSRWESSRLDPNDLGFLGAPNEASSYAWVQRRYIPGDDPKLNQGNINLNLWKGWLFAGERREDESGNVLWDYGSGHHQNFGGNVNSWVQFRNYWSAWGGLSLDAKRTDQFITRGGPLMQRPEEYGGWWGFSSDWRKSVSWELYGNYNADGVGGRFKSIGTEANWNASNSVSLSADVEVWNRQERADYLDTIERDSVTDGIGGNSYVFGDLDQNTLEFTLRSNLLFSRNKSLELYAQPFLTVGSYTNARELVTPDSYDLEPYSNDGFEADDFDFRFAAVNLNLVYRYEYRPGSTFFLVWTHSRDEYEDRGEATTSPFRNNLSAGDLFSNEPENTVLAKFTYWLPL